MDELKKLLLTMLVEKGPDLVNAGIAALVDRLMHHASQPSPAPAPAPAPAALPPAFQAFLNPPPAAPPTPAPAGSPVATGLELTIDPMYSPWFKPNADSSDEVWTEPTKSQILAGKLPVPPNALLTFNVEPTPPHLDLYGEPVIPVPLTLHYRVTGPGLQGEAQFTPQAGHSGPYESPLGKVKPARFDPSNGYTGTLVTIAPGGDGPSKGELWATGKLPDGTELTSNVVKFDWMAGH